jgi:KDO2-lipid IV(A) lauroyltransferase
LGRSLLRALGPRLQKSRQLRLNLRIAFPEKADAEIETLLRAVWGNLGAVLAEYPHLDTICAREADERLKRVVAGDIRALREPGTPGIFVAAHLANWEIPAAAAVRLGLPLGVLYTPAANPRVDRMLQRQRQVLGCTFFDRDADMRELLRHLSKGGCVGVIMDQRVDSGEPIPFFGHDKATTLVPARLALRLGCELVPVRVQRLEGARFRLTFYDPVRPDPGAANEVERARQMMAKVNLLFEAWIREQPQDWLCSKRRWPKDVTPVASSRSP